MSIHYNLEESIPMPSVMWDNQGFWEGVKRHDLVFQKCRQCGTLVHPPRPMCPACRSFDKEWARSSGRGKVYSWITYRESAHPSFRPPYSVVLVELDEGVRVVSNLVDAKPDEIEVGMPVEVVFDDISDELTLPKFKKVD